MELKQLLLLKVFLKMKLKLKIGFPKLNITSIDSKQLMVSITLGIVIPIEQSLCQIVLLMFYIIFIIQILIHLKRNGIA